MLSVLLVDGITTNLTTKTGPLKVDISTTEHFLKKILTYSESGRQNRGVLVNVYKSLISSQVVANATTLCSVSESVKRDMLAIEKRALKIMNVKESDFLTLKIKDIDDLINERCIQQMDKILADNDHPITLSLHKRNTGITRNTFHSTPTTKPKTPCPTCEKSFIRLNKMHQRVHAKDNSALTETHYSTLPDFNNNYEHVTTRKTSTAQLHFKTLSSFFNYNHYFCLTPL